MHMMQRDLAPKSRDCLMLCHCGVITGATCLHFSVQIAGTGETPPLGWCLCIADTDLSRTLHTLTKLITKNSLKSPEFTNETWLSLLYTQITGVRHMGTEPQPKEGEKTSRKVIQWKRAGRGNVDMNVNLAMCAWVCIVVLYMCFDSKCLWSRVLNHKISLMKINRINQSCLRYQLPKTAFEMYMFLLFGAIWRAEFVHTSFKLPMCPELKRHTATVFVWTKDELLCSREMTHVSWSSHCDDQEMNGN